ncbi:hypothetical protein MRB53_013137 [Persea americana]|uniref:Uncharacterized protein n=1 Tax=Persea americana TaxID=3435 RepID=A0ACC2K743_PERAE|nr:hypothetical protein MRB53_013137 [Persea americana]
MSPAPGELKSPESSPASVPSQGSPDGSRFSNLRGVQWRIDLGILPSSSSSIEDLRRTAAASRRKYARLRRRLLIDPHLSKDDGNKASDIVMDNPLSQNPDSMWGRFFRNAELEKMVDQDLSRLYPEHGSYFQTLLCQAMLRRILLLWCLRHPEYGYRQGMHELLAPLVYVLHVDVQHLSQVRELYEDHFSDKFDDMCDRESCSAYTYNFTMISSPISSKLAINDDRKNHQGTATTVSNLDELDPTVKTIVLLSDAYGAEGELGILLSERFMEHDAYCMFDALMSGAGGAVAMADYYSLPSAVGSLSGLPPVIEASSALYHLLSIVDSSLHSHLVELEIEPQYFALRWLRVLFGREFSLEDLLIVWDEIFASCNTKSLLGTEDDYLNSLMLLSSPRGAFIAAIAVAMLLQVRSSLLATENATTCLQRLLNFPESVDVDKLIQKAKSFQALALDTFTFPSPSLGALDSNKSASVRCYSLSKGSVSPKTPLSLVPESYWEEKWRVLHKDEELRQGKPSDPLSVGTKVSTEKEKLNLARTESAPPSLKVSDGKKGSRISVRRRLLEDLSRELGGDVDVDKSGSNEVVGAPDPIRVEKELYDDPSEQNDLENNLNCMTGDACFSEPAAATEENSSVCSAMMSPFSATNDHENDLEKSSIMSNSSADDNDNETNNSEETYSSAGFDDLPPSNSPPEVIAGSHQSEAGAIEQAAVSKECKPVSSKFQWFWKFGKSSEGAVDKGDKEAQRPQIVGSQNAVKCSLLTSDCNHSSSTRSTEDTADKNVMVTLRNLGQSMLENIQVIESVFQQDRGQIGSLENLSRNILGGKRPGTAMSALKELRKISNLLSEM